MHDPDRHGFSLIGLLVTMVIIIILASIGMTALQGSMGGSGTPIQENQATVFIDRHNIKQIGTSMFSFASSNNSRMPSPTGISGSNDKSLDTSANFWSSMVAQQWVYPEMLESKNEPSMYVSVDEDYDYNAYDPSNGVYWDTSFRADLTTDSNVSFAHEVLVGERFRRNWIMGAPMGFPLIGNRGPENGIASKDSMACDATGNWAGNMFYGDGHVEFLKNPTSMGDNIFAVDGEWDASDAIITFTTSISDNGFDVQWD